MIDNNLSYQKNKSGSISNGLKVILTGGGTLGSVSPLVALWQEMKQADSSAYFLFVGTKNGPEKDFLKKYEIEFQPLPSIKFRRYFSFLNVVDFFKLFFVIIRSVVLLKRFKPDVIISAGGFIAVPLVWAAKFFSKTKVVLYQSDLRAGLANKLCQKRANLIFTAFKETLSDFPKNKTFLAGALIRQECSEVDQNKIHDYPPRILILGGGTGSKFINDLIAGLLPELTTKYQVNHVTGKNKRLNQEMKNYSQFELLDQDYYEKINQADLVISRAGLSTLMELAFLGKAIILIPLADSPQTANAEYFSQKQSVLIYSQKENTKADLLNLINRIMTDNALKEKIQSNVKNIFLLNGREKISQEIFKLCQQTN
jgi:UDP-N-acetylglucosamine--N-acetylmuramyl-(pentapeptide) pyrophosphoryl-undecaprenol N-acetylglucosamine transferase